MSKLFLIALSFALLSLARSDHPMSWYREFEDITFDDVAVSRNDERVYRLPENVIPVEYDIYIDLYFDERTDRPFSYDGRETIVIQAVEEGVTQIVLHANVDNITDVTLRNNAGIVVPLASRPFETEPLYHFLKINLINSLVPNVNYTLSIEYSSTMNEGPMKRGIWRGWYVDANGRERIYATTHFQPYNARQAFPCWDEPLFKAVFKLHLSKPAGYDGTFSNTKIDSNVTLSDNRVRTDFAETPTMSSYLVTFLVSETFQVIAENTTFNPPIRIIGRSNTVGLADHSLNLAVKMIQFFNEYFDYPYSTLHPNLMNDHISSPDWASAGTENWGMVSYRELYMVIDKSETLMSVEHYAGTLVSHELAHKWFGNLITCYWWSNTWINEGYASYFGYMATNEMFPEYEYPDHFNNRYLQTSLSFDSGTSTAALNHEVNTPAQVTGHFGTISYSKAAAFLRMTANIMSLETFKKSCRKFLKTNSYKPTDQFDLLNAMNEAILEDNSLADYGNFNFTEYYTIWVNEPGYPILKVEVNHTTGYMVLLQERFFISASAAPTAQVYPIPITYSTKSNPNFSNVKPSVIMSQRTHLLQKNAGEEWVIFNNLQYGHYRVDYDEKTWNLISNALFEEPESIHYLNRAQIVDDVFALMRSERMSLDLGFNILRFLANETNNHVWEPAVSGLTWFRNRLRHIPEKQKEFDDYILAQMAHAISVLGLNPTTNETPTISMARQTVLHFACTLGHEGCVKDAVAKFANLKNNNVPISAVIRRHVYTSAMREGDTSDFDFLLARFRASNIANDQLEMLRGMGAARNTASLNRYLRLTLDKVVRSHDKLNAFNYALLGHPDNAKTVLEFVMNNIDQIRTAYIDDSPVRPVHSALSNLASYLDEAGLVTYENWLRSTQSGTAQYSTAISGISSARSSMAWGTANADAILRAARGNAIAAVASFTLLITMAVISLIV